MSIKKIFLIIILIIPFTGVGQIVPPPVPPPPPPGLPIDGFASALFVLGVIYGVNKKIKA